MLPESCAPTLITDGGFESAWFSELDRFGWDYVGRARGQRKFLYKNNWLGCRELHKLAGKRDKMLGSRSSPKRKMKQKAPVSRRVVIAGTQRGSRF